MYSPTEKEIFEETVRIKMMASIEILTDTIAEIAILSGISELEGIPIRTYIVAKRMLREEQMCADFADTNPSLAAGVRQLLESSRPF